MIKRTDMLRHLLRYGCRRVRQGARHEIRTDATGDLRAPVPRHRELPRTTARAICRQLGVPPV
jgi:hypothetical protein